MSKQDVGITAVAHAGDSESLVEKKKRVRQELVKAGMTPYGLRKFNTRYIPSFIKDGEHIHGVVYGRHVEGAGFLSWIDRMMIATDHRIVSFNHKPGYTDFDVFTYDVVNGVYATEAGPFRAVMLDTRTGKVVIRFVNKRCSTIFIRYVAERRMTFFKTRTAQHEPASR